MVDSFPELEGKSAEQLNQALQDIEYNLSNYKMVVNVESEKMEKYRVKEFK